VTYSNKRKKGEILGGDEGGHLKNDCSSGITRRFTTQAEQESLRGGRRGANQVSKGKGPRRERGRVDRKRKCREKKGIFPSTRKSFCEQDLKGKGRMRKFGVRGKGAVSEKEFWKRVGLN